MTYSPFRHIGAIFHKKKPIQLTVFLTRQCNARCPFCFYLSGHQGKETTKQLSLNELEKVAGSLGNLLWLAFSGGEIFLRKDLVAIVDAFYKNTKPAIILLPTNGLLPEVIYEQTEKILQQCPRSTIAVKVSIDGPAAIHNQLRGVDGAYQKAMTTFSRLTDLSKRYNNFELGINSVFCAENQQELPGIIREINKLQSCKTHTVSLIRGTVSNPALKEIDLNAYKKTSEVLADNLRSKTAAIYGFFGARLKAAQDILQRNLIYKTALLKKRQLSCHAGRLTLTLTENGDVFPCESFTRKIGNVRQWDYDLDRMYRSKGADNARKRIGAEKCCCTHECYMMMNILFTPRLYPALFKEYIELLRLSAGTLKNPLNTVCADEKIPCSPLSRKDF